MLVSTENVCQGDHGRSRIGLSSGGPTVERVSSYFEPWAEDRLILDSVEPVTRNLEKAIRYVRADRQLAERQID
jgi:hypothetical protein